MGIMYVGLYKAVTGSKMKLMVVGSEYQVFGVILSCSMMVKEGPADSL